MTAFIPHLGLGWGLVLLAVAAGGVGFTIWVSWRVLCDHLPVGPVKSLFARLARQRELEALFEKTPHTSRPVHTLENFDTRRPRLTARWL